jgi:hypothetical protein
VAELNSIPQVNKLESMLPVFPSNMVNGCDGREPEGLDAFVFVRARIQFGWDVREVPPVG